MPNTNVWGLIAGHPDGDHGDVDGVGAAARFNTPRGIGVDASGTHAFVVDYGNKKVKHVDLLTGAVTTVGDQSTWSGLWSVPARRPIWGCYVQSHDWYLVFFQDGMFDKHGDVSATAVYDKQAGTWTATSNAPADCVLISGSDSAGVFGVAPTQFGGSWRLNRLTLDPGTLTWSGMGGVGCPNCRVDHGVYAFTSWTMCLFYVSADTSQFFYFHDAGSFVAICRNAGENTICYNCSNPAPSIHDVVVASAANNYDGCIEATIHHEFLPGKDLVARVANNGKLNGVLIDTATWNATETTIVDVTSPVHGIAWSNHLQMWIGCTHAHNWDTTAENTNGSTNGTGFNQIVGLGTAWTVGSVRIADSGLVSW